MVDERLRDYIQVLGEGAHNHINIPMILENTFPATIQGVVGSLNNL